MNRAVRLVYLMQLLSERPHTLQELAALCDTSERTIRRDLLDLQCEPLRLPLEQQQLWSLHSSDKNSA